MTAIVLAPRAQADLRDACNYVAADNPGAAAALLDRFIQTLELLASRTVEGPVAVLRDGRRVRRWSLPPYRIYYRRKPQRLEVVRIYHQARRPIE